VSAIVLIGPRDALAKLREQLATENEVQTFTDHDVREAVEFIATARPAIVALEEEFAVSARGEALIGRITDDPALTSCDVRVLSREPRLRTAAAPAPAAGGGGTKAATGPSESSSSATTAPAALATVEPALDQRGTRRAPRVRVMSGVPVTVDGNAAELVDISAVGAQVVSKIILRPNQRVRLALPEGKRSLRCAGSVVWATFEMPQGQQPRYRAGLKLSGIEGESLQSFAERHRARGSGEPG
jgi:PilZ domain